MESVNPKELKFIEKVMRPSAFRMFILKDLPMAYLAGLKLKSLDTQKCEVSIKYKWINKNPFSSIYFACLAMAGEMATGLMAMAKVQGHKPEFALLVVGIEAMFMKKATGVITFTCDEGEQIDQAIKESKETGEARSVTLTSSGRNSAGEPVARFEVTWSFKQRS